MLSETELSRDSTMVESDIDSNGFIENLKAERKRAEFEKRNLRVSSGPDGQPIWLPFQAYYRTHSYLNEFRKMFHVNCVSNALL